MYWRHISYRNRYKALKIEKIRQLANFTAKKVFAQGAYYVADQLMATLSQLSNNLGHIELPGEHDAVEQHARRSKHGAPIASVP